jgi:hypothetical protein
MGVEVTMKRFFKIAGRIFLFLLLLGSAVDLSLRIPVVQNYIAHAAVSYISKKLGTKVEIQSFSWSLFKDVDMKGFYMADKKGDTLIYAGNLNAEISYWSLIGKQIKIKGISLEDARIHLQNDTAGNLNLTSIFSIQNPSGNKVKLVADTTSIPLNIIVDLENASLVNTDFRFEDLKKHLLISVRIPSCLIDVNKLALQKKLIDIHTITVVGVTATVTVEAKDQNAVPPPIDMFHFLPSGWMIRWDGISLSNSAFAYTDKNKAPKKAGIDFAHLALSDIILKAKKGALFRDSIDADIRLLAAREKSGFEIKKMGGLAKVSVNEISLRNLFLQTANSRINTFLALKYSNFEDFNDFTDSVTIHADLHDAAISMKDISYFADKVAPLAHNTINISGKLRGKIKDIEGKNITLSTALGTYLKCNFTANGLPNIDETSLNLKIDQFVTSASDIQMIYPSTIYPANLKSLGKIDFSGDFDGFISDFVARGKLYTDIGSATSDLNFKYSKKTAKSAYSGELTLNDFDLGKWFGDPVNYGKVSLHTSIEGGGIKLETLNAKLLGDISSLTLKGYNYKDVKVDGLVKGKFFSGNLIVKDQYLDADFTGTVDMTEKIPRYNFAASVRTAHFRDLHITKDTFNLSGDVTADFSGRKADDMIGSLILSNVFVQHGHESVIVRNLTATSSVLPDDRKEIKLKSDDIEGEITGQFSFTGLPKAMRNYFNYTFTRDYEDTGKVDPQQFDFELRIFDSSAITRVIDPRFKEIRNTTFSGELNTINHILNVRGMIPELIFDKYTFEHFDLNAKSEDGKLDVMASLDQVYVSDSLMAMELESHTYTEGDEFRFDFKGADAKNYNKADITAYLKPLKSSAEIRFLPSAVWLGGNKWSFSPNNHIVVHGKQITTDSLIFASGAQSIRLDSYLKNDTSTSIDVSISETSLGDFVNIFNNKVRDLKGTVNGSLKVEDIFSNPAPTGNLEIKDLYLGKIPIGIIKVNSTLDNVDKKVNIDATLFGDKSNLAINGFYDLKNNEINLNNDITSINLNILNYPLFDKYVRRVSGTASAKLILHGPVTALDLRGTLRINEAKVNVTYINTTYTLRNEDIEVGDGYFDIGKIEVIDTFNNKAIGTGRIYHEHFKKITLDLHVDAEKEQVLNTTVKDMPVFYGNGIVKGKVDFTGTIPAVTIRAYAQARAGTHCYIPINNSYETNRYTFYRFVNPQKDTIKIKRKEELKAKGVNFILDLDVTPDATIDVILDPATGDILTSRGRGEIKLEILRNGEFNIYGRYEIEQGNYLFTMQNLVNKKFEMDKGGTITFKGDVNNAQLDIDAVYRVKTSTYDLISDLLAANGSGPGSDADSRAKNRINVDLLLNLKGVLQSPEISFDIRPIDPDPAVRTYVDNKMQLMRTTESEMNKQVFGLLVMNRFLPSGNSTTADAITSSRSIGNSATNTVSEFLSSQLSMYMGSFFDNLNVRDLDLNLNFQSYDQTSLTTQTSADNLNARKEVQLALTKKFFNNRLSVNVGGNLDFGDNYQYVGTTTNTTNNKNAYASGDFEVEYVLDKNGSWRAKTYNKNDYDNFNNRNINKTGIGLSFRKDFDRWLDLFKRKNKKPKLQYVPKPDAKPEDAPKALQK